MMFTMEVQNMLYAALNEHKKHNRYEAMMAFNTAIDLWDGMLKGKTDDALLSAIENFQKAIDENTALDWTTKEEKSAYSQVKGIVSRLMNEKLAKEQGSK